MFREIFWYRAVTGVGFGLRNYHARPTSETIFALATPPGRAGVAVIRVSGSNASEVLQRMTRIAAGSVPPRQMTLTAVVHPRDGEVLDRGMFAFFPGPRSFTGEDVVELHLHGGPSIVKEVTLALGSLPSFRPADKGEFTQRAFMNGKMDLTAVEGLKDMINAETSLQRKIAIKQYDGDFASRYGEWRESIISMMGSMEALIDFGEDEQFEEGIWESTRKQAVDLRLKLTDHLNDGRRGEIVRSGIRATIFGGVNVGKSTLINYLVGRRVAIVSDIPGTTRDIVESLVDVGGYPVLIGDTAGIRQLGGSGPMSSGDLIEQIGMDLTRNRLEKGTDLRIAVIDLSCKHPDPLSQLTELGRWIDSRTIVVLNKCDVVHSTFATSVSKRALAVSPYVCVVSLSTTTGVGQLVETMSRSLAKEYGLYFEDNAPDFVANERHRIFLMEAVDHLARFLDLDDVVIAAEELRRAAWAIGNITGQVGSEHVLDAIFSGFCIGK